MQTKSSLSQATNAGFVIVAAVVLARIFLVLPMAQLLLLGAILHFIAGLFVLPTQGISIWKKTLFLSLPYFLAGAIAVFFMLADIFYLIPAAGPISAFAGFYIRERWRSSGTILIVPVLVLWVVLIDISYNSITPKALSHDFDIDLSQPAPEFSAQTPGGSRIESDSFSGKVTLIDFWGTWCPPCLRQFPELQELYDQYKEHPDVGILMLNTGWSGDDPEKIQRFLEKYTYTFPVAYDDNSVSVDYGITSLPHLVLVDKKGIIRMRHTGLMKEKGHLKKGLVQRIEELLKEE